MRKTNGLPAGGAKFIDIPPYAGGYVCSIQFDNAGNKTITGDVHGAWRQASGSTTYVPLFTSTSLPAGDVALWPGSNNGSISDSYCVYAVAPAPSDGTKLYGTWNGYIYKSTNSGASWTRLTGGPYTMRAGGGTVRLFNNKIAIDPQNPSVFMLGTMENKLLYSVDGSTVTTIAVTNSATLEGLTVPIMVACDQSSSVVGSIKQKWAYGLWGTGVLQSTTGPSGTFSLVTGSPTQPHAIVYGPNGDCWCLNYGETGGVYRKTSAGNFAKVTITAMGSGNQAGMIAVDPSDATGKTVVVMDINSQIYRTTDGGTTWSAWGLTNQSIYSTSIAWFGKQTGASLAPNGTRVGASSKLQFHPSNGQLYVTFGFGVYSSTPPASTASPWVWCEDCLGFKLLEMSNVLRVPGGGLYCSAHDRGCFTITDETRDTNLSSYGDSSIAMLPIGLMTLESCWFVDYVPGQPTHIVQTTAYNAQASGISKDSGKTWAPFAARPNGTFGYGQIVPASDTELYWFASNNQLSLQSTDGGQTWTPLFMANASRKANAVWDSGNAQLTFTSVADFDDISNPLYIVALNAPSGAGSITYDAPSRTITVTPATGAASATAIAAQLNASSTSNTKITTVAGGTGAGIPATSSAILVSYDNGLSNLLWNYARPACSDKTTGDLYLWHAGQSYQSAPRGVWKKPFGGSWVQQFSGYIFGTTGAVSAHLKCVPGNSGHLFWKGNNDAPLMRSTNGGVIWSAVSLTTNVYAFGFGKAAVGQSYPAIYFYGFYNSVLGLYRSDDNFASAPVKLTDYPGGNMDVITWIEGDPDVYGRGYISFGHTGLMRFDYDATKTLD